MRAELGLPSVKGDDEHGGGMTGGFGGSMGGAGQGGKGKRPISVKFEIPYFTTSGIQVRYLKIIEPKVSPLFALFLCTSVIPESPHSLGGPRPVVRHECCSIGQDALAIVLWGCDGDGDQQARKCGYHCYGSCRRHLRTCAIATNAFKRPEEHPALLWLIIMLTHVFL